VEVSGYNLPKKVYLLVIPPLEKGGEGGFENSWEWICFRIIKV